MEELEEFAKCRPDTERVISILRRAEHDQGGGGWQQTRAHTHKQLILQPQQLPQDQRVILESCNSRYMCRKDSDKTMSCVLEERKGHTELQTDVLPEGFLKNQGTWNDPKSICCFVNVFSWIWINI